MLKFKNIILFSILTINLSFFSVSGKAYWPSFLSFEKSPDSKYLDCWQNSQIFNYSKAIPSDAERTSFHEAGHVLVASLLDFEVQQSTIKPDSKNNGLTPFKYLFFNKEKMIKVYLAGYAAEEIIYGKACYGIYDDLNIVAKYLLEDYQDPNLKFVEYLSETKKIILDNLNLLHKLAERLLLNETLSKDEILNILNSIN